MRLRPRYGSAPILTMDGDPTAIAEPMVRQRRRLVESLAGLNEAEWRHQSRCDAWTSQGVVTHLTTVNGFWEASIRAGLSGTPTEFLTTFDPVESPAQLVAANTDSPEATLEAFVASVESLDGLVAGLDDADWRRLAEAPPGHISISALAHHALWDSWTHERDVLLPLGASVAEEPDEIVACLRYVFAFSAALAINHDVVHPVTFDVVVEDPAAHFHVQVADDVRVVDGRADGDPVVHGGALDVLEAASLRTADAVEFPPELTPVLAGLRRTFDQ